MLSPLKESKTQMLPQDDVETLKKNDFLSDLKGMKAWPFAVLQLLLNTIFSGVDLDLL